MSTNGAAWILVILALAIYFIPFIIAATKGKNNTGAIFALNLFLGWSIIGWVVALVWALTVDPPSNPKPAKYRIDLTGAKKETGQYCKSCGNKLSEKSKFCPSCGAEIDAG